MGDSTLNAIYFYRFFSLFLTSVYYLTVVPHTSYACKFVVVGGLALSAVILNYLYLKFGNAKRVIKVLITLETIGNVIVLIPTGGLNSPYIWYSLNTILITAYFLNHYYFYFNLVTYSTTVSILSFYIINKPDNSFIGFLKDNSNLLLSYILIIIAIKCLMEFAKRLNSKSNSLSTLNRELSQANKMIEESMENTAAFYRIVHNFTDMKSKDKLISAFAKYTQEITRSPMAFVCLYDANEGYLFDLSGEISEDLNNELLNTIKQLIKGITYREGLIKLAVGNKDLLAFSIKSSNEVYGVIGIETGNGNSLIIKRECINQLKFLASLSSILFERFKFEEMNQLLLIAEERNRIANEIHDSVSQELFYILCKVQTLIKDAEKNNAPGIEGGLNLVKSSLSSAMNELKEVIYGYSRKGIGTTVFEEKLRNYLNEVSQLNDVKIEFDITGNQELASYEIKKVIYRLLNESIGNAIRHGMSKNLKVMLVIDRDIINLKIDDDGVGFDLKDKLSGENVGLGINNLHNLAHSLGGNIVIDSKPNKGTSINVTLPNIDQNKGIWGKVV